jgi:integrase
MAARKTPGIRVRHSRKCASNRGRGCNCNPTYEAAVSSRRDRKKIRRTFPTRQAAQAWRHDAQVAVRKGAMRAPTPITLKQAADAWLAGARDGSICNRSGDRYKPSAIRGYDGALRLRVLPALGGYRLADLRLTDVQDFADSLLAKGMDASTIRNTIMPLRAIYGRALARGEVAVNPTSGLTLPSVRGARDRIASPTEAAALIAALPAEDRPAWATAMYAGLRAGELVALRCEDVDLATGLISVERGWDLIEGVIEPKSSRSRRRVPIPPVLRDYLDEHMIRLGRGSGFIFGKAPDRPLNLKTLRRRADKAWEKAELERITLHECRHTFASLMIAAGVNAKALSTYMGHANIAITMDRYGHLMPGSEEEAASRLHAYLQRADEQARTEQAQEEPAAA